jgi:acetyltransferase-like isoleucine patch superfamily enzyme
MPLKIDGNRSQNEIRINETFAEKSNGSLHIRGTGNTVIIDTERHCGNLFMQLQGGSRFEVQANVKILSLNLFLRDGSEVVIGENCYANGKLNIMSHEKARVIIGKNCQLGGGLLCVTSDMHSILDVETGKRINPPGDIILEDKVWTGFDVTLFKGTYIGTGCVVGARSSVSGHFRPNSLLLGYPARVAKRGVSWHQDLLPLEDDLPMPEPEAN